MTLIRQHRILSVGLVGLALLSSVFVLPKVQPYAVDWQEFFRPAAITMLAGQSPYTNPDFPSPPWVLLPMIPVALLPSAISQALWFILSIGGFAYAVQRLGAKPLALAAFVASPLVMHSLLNGNIDWIVVMGFSLPPQIGLFLVVAKPQMSSVVVLFWLIEAWRRNGWREVARVFWPVVTVTLISFLLYGFWPLIWLRKPSQYWNASLWPVSIPIGLTLAVAAIYRRRLHFAMSASPLLSPYVLFHAYSGALAALATFTVEMVTAVIGLWILVLIRGLGVS